MSGEVKPEEIFKEMDEEKENKIKEVEKVVKEKKIGVSAARKEVALKVLKLLEDEGVAKDQLTKVLSRAYNLVKKAQ